MTSTPAQLPAMLAVPAVCPNCDGGRILPGPFLHADLVAMSRLWRRFFSGRFANVCKRRRPAPMIHDPGRLLVGGTPRSVIVDARFARQLARLLHQYHAGLCDVWVRTDPDAAATLAALARAGAEWTQKESATPTGRSELPPVVATADSYHDEIDTAEVARRLGCSPRNVRSLRDRGRLNGRLVAGRLLYTPEDVAAYAAQRKGN